MADFEDEFLDNDELFEQTEGEGMDTDDEFGDNDPLTPFHASYIVTKEDGSAPVQYSVTIKGEYPEPPSKIGFYNVVYSDDSIKVIDWEPGGVGWIERGVGKTAHSLSIGSLIEKHFGPDED